MTFYRQLYQWWHSSINLFKVMWKIFLSQHNNNAFNGFYLLWSCFLLYLLVCPFQTLYCIELLPILYYKHHIFPYSVVAALIITCVLFMLTFRSLLCFPSFHWLNCLLAHLYLADRPHIANPMARHLWTILTSHLSLSQTAVGSVLSLDACQMSLQNFHC